jgi:cobaltochelatase CobS
MALIQHGPCSKRGCRKCGSTDLYWAHDTEGKPGRRYCAEHESLNWMLVDSDGIRHDCQGTGHDDSEPDEVPEQAATPAPVPATPDAMPAATGNPALDAFNAFMAAVAPKVDANQVKAIIDERLAGLVLPLRVEVTRDGMTRPVEGLAHRVLPMVITIMLAGKHVMMVGPAGTGKSHIAGQAAEALGLESYSISLSPQTPTSAILGYMTATGDYVRSLFREAYEYGGVFHFDEVDNSHPSVLAVINGALANGHMAFPDGMVKRSPDFRCVASANTYGNGPDRAYVGRQAMDLATKDRFEIVDVPVDEALEESLCLATGLGTDRVKRVLAYVRYLRGKAVEYKLPLSFSPRRSHGACALLQAGMTGREVIEVSIRRGISDADWSKVSAGAPGF